MEHTYFDRDLSWLRFNHRVLQEARDNRNPLYERIKFLAIYSANLDEFFKVRVSDIRKIRGLKKNFRKKLISKPNRLLKAIKKEVNKQGDELGEIYSKQICPLLLEEGIELIHFSDFNDELKTFALDFYKSNLESQLVVRTQLKSEEDRLSFESESLYLFGLSPNDGLVSVEIPGGSNRFVKLPKTQNHRIVYVDDILKYALESQYNCPFYSIKISRDAELYIEDEYSGNLLEKIISSLPNRDSGQVTRALIEKEMPEEIQEAFKTFLDINETDIVCGGNYHNLKDFFAFPNPTEKDLSAKDLEPKRQKDLANFENMFDAISVKDRLFYFPYESFSDVVRLIEEASKDSSVAQIKMTLYRVSKDSAVAKALLEAVKNGIDVYVFIETKARFDEENNIYWGQKLSDAGARVMYSYPGIKVHSKILYICREEEGVMKGYGYIGSGNFNEKTSKIYTDFGLMTARKKICSDLLQVFKVLEGKLIVPKSKRLLISPFNSRKEMTALVDAEIEQAKKVNEAYIILKMNSLQDKKLIEKLYEASNAGVCVRLIIRGICCLIPGVKGQSENIFVTSIVGQFLEHARVYIFCSGGKEKMYMGSADWMTRNLDHRIEVLTPILDKDNFNKLRKAVDLQIEDKVKARKIDKKQMNSYVVENGQGISSQILSYEELV